MIAAPLPAVVAVSDAINEPRYPSLKGIMGAKKKPQETSRSPTSASTPARPARPARARRCSRSSRRRRAASDQVKIEDDGTGAEKIVDFLAEKRLV